MSAEFTYGIFAPVINHIPLTWVACPLTDNIGYMYKELDTITVRLLYDISVFVPSTKARVIRERRVASSCNLPE